MEKRKGKLPFVLYPKVIVAVLSAASIFAMWMPKGYDISAIMLAAFLSSWLMSEVYTYFTNITTNNDPYRGVNSRYAIVQILEAGARTPELIAGDRYGQADHIVAKLNASYDDEASRLDRY